MLSLLLSAYLGVTASCTGPQCMNGVTATITITATIVAANSLALESKPLEIDGAYAVYARIISTGHEGAFDKNEKYLILDDNPMNDKDPVMFAMDQDGLVVSSKSPEYFVMIWPDKYDLPNARELLALKEAVFESRNLDVAIAKMDRFYKKKSRRKS